MQFVTATHFGQWREIARSLLAAEIPPTEVQFSDSELQLGLFESETCATAIATQRNATHHVPKPFLKMAEAVACHSSQQRWNLLYRVLWRLTHGERHLLEVATDDDIHQLMLHEKAVRRDAHKMKAFVRFRKVVRNDEEYFIAWHRPDHRIARITGPFFSRRFPEMQWSILMPNESVSWDRKSLSYGPGVPRSGAPSGDELEALWKTYYGAIFNPARIKLKMMTSEMPVRYWPALPETAIIPELLADAPRRVAEMLARNEGPAQSATDFLPEVLTYESLRAASLLCQGCDLHRDATQTVFGEGTTDAEIMIVGEQPGDSEDIAGKPFVGPAGKVLNAALTQVGIQREDVYVTNAVKHFKFDQRGNRRLHKRPGVRETTACQPWVAAEIALVKPKVLVCLGATSAQQLIGRDTRITRESGRFRATRWCEHTIVTWHPSAILRQTSDERRVAVQTEFVKHFAAVAAKAAQLRS